MVRLDLKQNALHTLYHGIEHMRSAEGDAGGSEGRPSVRELVAPTGLDLEVDAGRAMAF